MMLHSEWQVEIVKARGLRLAAERKWHARLAVMLDLQKKLNEATASEWKARQELRSATERVEDLEKQ